MLNSHFIGEITEQEVALEFLKRGIQVSKPLVQSSRYDFIIDVNDILYKVQVKTCALKDEGARLEFATSTSHTNTRGTKNLSYKSNEVDFFATFFNGECYLIPYNICGKRTQNLRLAPTKNGQVQGIKFAKDYVLDKQLELLQ